MLSNRLLDEVIYCKKREKEHAAQLRQSLTELEPPYVRLLQEWERVLDLTISAARSVQGEAQAEPLYAAPPIRAALLRGLVNESVYQTREFSRQLQLLQADSAVVRALGTDVTLTALQPSAGSQEMEDDSPEGYGGPQPADGHERRDADDPASWTPDSPRAPASGGQPVPIGGHKLPPLPYPYQALEPYIDEKTMRIHHDKHHQSYVDGLNKAEQKLAEARRSGDFDLVKHWERELAFNGAGHYLHTIFWDAMAPKSGGKPTGALADQIAKDFGSYDAFKQQFSEAANKVEGGGWAILVWSPRAHRLEILTAEKHQNLSQWDVVPLLPLDVWEHAYYLKHQNNRGDYVKDWWNVVNWPFVADRFGEARKLQWTPY
ncbi:superoxide dismutase [Cohnella nanjingensis]|nr:superoxide dismutase [Cohnella nanjingensis]